MKKSDNTAGKTNADLIHQILLNVHGTPGNSLPSFAPAFSFISITTGLIASKKENLSLPAYSDFY